MARRPFRRRRRVTWLPTNGTVLELVPETIDAVVNPFTLIFNHNFNTGYTASDVVPLNPYDIPIEPGQVTPDIATGGPTLVDVIGNEYIVERIVGNCYGTVLSNDAGDVANSVRGILLALGVCVARADDQNPGVPAGFTNENFNPLHLSNTREPWMFRRTWLLNAKQRLYNATILPNPTIREAYGQLPAWTTEYHGINTGPFFDIRSKRRIRQDERLWMIAGICGQPMLTEALSGITQVSATIDLRILGALRRAKNRSNF